MSPSPPVRSEVPAAITACLVEGEVVRWWGRPRQGLFLRRFDVFFIAYSVIFAAMIMGIALKLLGRGGFSVGTALFVVLVVLPANYGLWGRFILDVLIRRGMLYAVTSRRCLTIGTWIRPCIRSFARGSTDYRLQRHSNGLGTIRFLTSSFDRRSLGAKWFGLFDQIPDADVVYRLVGSIDGEDAPHLRPSAAPHRHPRPDAQEPGHRPGPFDADRW